MSIRVRQICLVAHDLDKIQHQLEGVFGIAVAHRDPGVGKYGLHNFLMPVGDQLLEAVAPKPGEHDTPGGRYLHRRGGDGGYMVIMQVPKDHYPAFEARVDALGIRRVSEPGAGRTETAGMQLHPKDVPGAIAELRWNADEARPDGGWWPAGENWQGAKRTDVVASIIGAEIQAEEPDAVAALWSALLDVPIRHDEVVPTLVLDGTDLRFVTCRDGRGIGLAGLDIACNDIERARKNAAALGCLFSEDQVALCGMRLNLVAR